MLDRLLNQVNILEKGLDVSWLKNDTIASNIANVDTPGYKAHSVSFESVFKSTMEAGSSYAAKAPAYQSFLDEMADAGAGVGDTKNQAGHSGGSRMTDIAGYNRQAVRTTDSTLRMDGNNVDIDYEMTELAKNTILYDALTYAANEEVGRLKLIISEGK